MDNPPMEEPESAIPTGQAGPVPLASIVVEALAAVLARREGREPARIVEATQPDRQIHSTE
jgi:hypothetical protein